MLIYRRVIITVSGLNSLRIVGATVTLARFQVIQLSSSQSVTDRGVRSSVVDRILRLRV